LKYLLGLRIYIESQDFKVKYIKLLLSFPNKDSLNFFKLSLLSKYLRELINEIFHFNQQRFWRVEGNWHTHTHMWQRKDAKSDPVAGKGTSAQTITRATERERERKKQKRGRGGRETG